MMEESSAVCHVLYMRSVDFLKVKYLMNMLWLLSQVFDAVTLFKLIQTNNLQRNGRLLSPLMT